MYFFAHKYKQTYVHNHGLVYICVYFDIETEAKKKQHSYTHEDRVRYTIKKSEINRKKEKNGNFKQEMPVNL